MKFKYIYCAFLISFFSLCTSAQPQAPGKLDFIKDVPETVKTAWDMSFNTKPKTLYTWGGIFASTAVLYYYDEEILAEFQRFGRRIGLGNDDHTKSFIRIGNVSVFRGPTDLGSALYFLGDGWTHAMISLGFVSSGYVMQSNRAMRTGSQIFNGMISSTIANQIAKRSFGRESPYRSSKKRGRWRPFPSFSTYNNNVSAYDAMPTGHLMTATLTFTVIDENYPEYRSWIRPLAFTWGTILGYQMINNGVHWISDYPLGIVMGYVFGKAATKKNKDVAHSNISVLPIFSASQSEHIYGVSSFYYF